MESLKNDWKNTVLIAVTGVVMALLVLAGYLTYASVIQSKPQEPRSLPKQHAHSVIAITCPCAPFFGFGETEGSELLMITSAFELTGQHAQYIYVPYEDALNHLEKRHVQGVLAFSTIHKPRDGDYLTEPLATRDFVAVTLADNQQVIEKREDLQKLSVGIHPDIFEVLQPQLMDAFKDTGSVQKISNYVLLSSMLLTGAIDTLIIEKSIFTHSLHSVPDDANPWQQVKYHQLFDPVYPKILFKDKTLRDRFNDAWKKITEAGTDSK